MGRSGAMSASMVVCRGQRIDHDRLQVLPPVVQCRELGFVALIERIGREKAQARSEALQPLYALAN